MGQKKSRIVEINNMLSLFEFSEYDISRLFNALSDYGRYPIADGALSVCFLDVENMREVHKKFLSDDSLTDVITFPGVQEFGFAGEICVSPDYAKDSAKIHGTSFSEELTLYLVHGYLHLAGLNDILEADIRKMRQAEEECMDLLKLSQKIPMFVMR